MNDDTKIRKNFVMKFGAIGKNSIFYRIACDCTDEQCDLTLELEIDANYKAVYLNLYKKLIASAHWGYNSRWGWFDWVRVIKNKIQMCYRIITKGYIEVSESFIIKDEEQIKGFIDALNEGKKFVCDGIDDQRC